MEKAKTITVSELEAALRQWDADAKSGKWAGRDDEDRHQDSARYLFDLLPG